MMQRDSGAAKGYLDTPYEDTFLSFQRATGLLSARSNILPSVRPILPTSC